MENAESPKKPKWIFFEGRKWRSQGNTQNQADNFHKDEGLEFEVAQVLVWFRASCSTIQDEDYHSNSVRTFFEFCLQL